MIDSHPKNGAAGNIHKIHHNTVYPINEMAVVIKGVPLVSCDIYNNWFLHSSIGEAVAQHIGGNFDVYDNLVGPNRDIADEIHY